MEYITLRLDSTNEVEQWYVRHNYFIVLLHGQHVSTYIQVIFRPSFTDKSIKMLYMLGSHHVNRSKIRKNIRGLCWSNKVQI